MTTPWEEYREACAKVCEEYAAIRNKEYESPGAGQGEPFIDGQAYGAHDCAERIRALSRPERQERGKERRKQHFEGWSGRMIVNPKAKSRTATSDRRRDAPLYHPGDPVGGHAGAAAPEDMVMVPREPTENMLAAGEKAILGISGWQTMYPAKLALDSYRAMLAASEKP